MLPAYYWHTSHTCKSSLIELHLYIWPLLGFLSFFIGGVKTQMIRSILSHLFKWREGSDYGVREKLICVENNYRTLREKGEKNHYDFCTPTRKRFLDYNCVFCSPLNWVDFWKVGSTHVILQNVRLDYQIDILREK